MTASNNSATRRSLLVGASSLVAASAHAMQRPSLTMQDLKKEADVACLYHCDYGDHARFAQTLNNIANHYSAYGADPFGLQLVIVAHSVAIKYFLSTLDETPFKDDNIPPKTFDRVIDLAKNGLKVHLCEITFQRLKVDKSKVFDAPFMSFVPSGVATVAALQSKGFAYLKVG
ncbi:DsrE family protein [Tardiphaga sp.]|uniref:DsrE family protein n=1 Tax=Tardiphaga sp. TaxID=1926292 RepID=UPI003529DAED